MLKLHQKVMLYCICSIFLSTVSCSSGIERHADNNIPAPTEKEPLDTVKILAANAGYEVPAVKNSMEIPEIKYLAEKTNTVIDLELLDNPPKYNELVRLKFAVGDYPDIYQSWQISTEDAVMNNLVEDVKPLVDLYGPNLKKNIPQFAWDAVTLNGKVVCIPTPAIGNAPAERLIYIRKDWMDNLGIHSIPGTSDELLDLYRAFRDKDPNGNGQKDEIPFSARENFTWIDALCGMWGVNWDSYAIVDGKAIPGFAAPNTKKVLEYLALMYRENLLDPDFLTLNSTTWKNKIRQDRVGSWVHVVGNAGVWAIDMKSALPGIKTDIITIPTPRGKGYDGPVGRMMQPVYSTHFIMKQSKVKEAAIRILDWLATDEGSTFSEYGMEGRTLIKNADGTYTHLKDKRKADKTMWLGSVFGLTESDAVRNKVLSEDPLEDIKYDAAIAVARQEGIPNPMWPMPMLKQEYDKPELKWDGKLIQEGFARIVFGAEPVDYFDEVIETWKKAGGDQIIEEATKWYYQNVKKY